jgi:hypothetical protein
MGEPSLLGVAVHVRDPRLHEFLLDGWVHGCLLGGCLVF